MKKCYTIGSINDISNDFDCVQFTENQRVWLTSRRSAQNINKLREAGVTIPVIVHQDFVYIASRYAMFSPTTKLALLDYLKSYNGCNVVGIVMHTDYPIKREVLKSETPQEAILDSYKASIWDSHAIQEHFDNIVEYSLVRLAQDIVDRGIKTRIYLENTTAVGPDNEASFPWLLGLFLKYPYFSQVYGLVYDTCHQYAVDGKWLPTDEIIRIHKEICPMIVHLNTIPEEVKPCSKRDRHSFTTIRECSVNTDVYYIEYANTLDKAGIPWVREIKQETIDREQAQLHGLI